MPKPKKRPWLAALLNFLLLGLGYVYNGKRTFLGVGLIIATFVSAMAYMLTPFPANLAASVLVIYVISDLMFSLLFAYDAYTEAQGMSRRK
jgi:uncharacterized membrane protein